MQYGWLSMAADQPSPECDHHQSSLGLTLLLNLAWLSAYMTLISAHMEYCALNANVCAMIGNVMEQWRARDLRHSGLRERGDRDRSLDERSTVDVAVGGLVLPQVGRAVCLGQTESRWRIAPEAERSAVLADRRAEPHVFVLDVRRF